jgi:hypothetical protein
VPVFTFSTELMLQGWQAAAENILAHFHAINGAVPLSLDWMTEENITKSQLDRTSVQYMKRMVYLIDQECKWAESSLIMSSFFVG